VFELDELGFNGFYSSLGQKRRDKQGNIIENENPDIAML